MSSERWMNTWSELGMRTIGIASVPLIAINMCWTSAMSRPLCSISMTMKSNPEWAICSATFGLPMPRKQPTVAWPALSFCLT